MFCQQCGKEIPSGSPTCPACGFNAMSHSAAAPSDPESVEKIISEMKRAAKDLSVAAANLSQRVADKAGRAAKDPSGSAKRATRKVAEELDKAAKEIDRVLRDL
jgi:uncharacterized Zn finger protein (UPF0148 family)